MDEDRLKTVEARLSRLEFKPKDNWDRAQIIGAALIPLAIAYAGHRYAATQHAATLQVDARQSEREYEVAQVNARIGQAGLVVSMLDALLSPDEQRQKLATEAVLIAMPETGPALVRLVARSDTSLNVRDFAQDALSRRRATLIADLFAETASRRGEAYAGLMAGWSNDSDIIPELLAYAREHRTDANGVNNVLIFLSHMSRDALGPHSEQIEAFSLEVDGIGPRTRDRAEVLRSRLPR